MNPLSKVKGVTMVVGAAVLSLGLAGCATKSYVNGEVGKASQASNAKIAEVQTQVESAQSDIAGMKQVNAKQDEQIAQLSDTAKDALDRAVAAGKLARGTFVYEVQLTDDNVHFPLNSAELSPEARKALDAFAAKLKEENRNVYIEIQGHTDTTGTKAYNLQLGQERATAVLRYLNMEDGVPLNRMSTISYGESKPIADNNTREGRVKNRRVTLVVMG
jgi:peptidoglycan-associated lipoprotein